MYGVCLILLHSYGILCTACNRKQKLKILSTLLRQSWHLEITFPSHFELSTLRLTKWKMSSENFWLVVKFYTVDFRKIVSQVSQQYKTVSSIYQDSDIIHLILRIPSVYKIFQISEFFYELKAPRCWVKRDRCIVHKRSVKLI